MAARRAKSTTLAAFTEPIPPPEERRANGKAIRNTVPRTSQGVWEATGDRHDPIELIIESNRTRDQSLVPLRYERMLQSPFTFLRGSALVMAHDLARTPCAGIDVRLCGDAHLANFGMYASPERRMVFDLNDFDETAQGPFEWDVKRLAASIVVAGRDNGFDAIANRRTVIAAVASYCDWMDRYSAMTHLDVWYSKIDAAEIGQLLPSSMRRNAAQQLDKMTGKNHLRALEKLTTVIDGRHRIVDDPPIVAHIDDEIVLPRLEGALTQYRSTLAADRQVLFDHYRFVDFARKVVGVGSVGTRCWMTLFQGPNGGPLFLQLKEARRSAPDAALGRPAVKHEGRRVVEGQRMLQATPDVLLGWCTDEVSGIQYYVRQMWDSKGSVDVASLGPMAMGVYAAFCGWALARAHARTGDSAQITGYMGQSDRFPESIADFAEAYADQTERDHAAMVDAWQRGLLA